MSNENTQDGAEPSGASAGSHVALHRAVRALLEGVNARYAKNPREWTCPHMQALDDMTQSEPQPTLTDAERAAISERDAAIRERDTAKAEVTRLRAKIRAIRELDRVERCQPAAAPQPASDLIGEIAELRFQLNKYRAKAAAYGGMVRGCNPALERAGHPVEDRGPDGAVGGIARAVEALVREREEARAEVTKLTAALESSRSVQPATETAAAAANDPVRDTEASDGPGDGWRWVKATGPDGPGEVHGKEDECRDCLGIWRQVRHVIGRVCDEPCTYRRRITPAEAMPGDGWRFVNVVGCRWCRER